MSFFDHDNKVPRVTVEISVQEQLRMWSDHSLNMDTMKIRLPNGKLVNSRVFNSMHFGQLFALDIAGTSTTRSAYTAYVKNMAYRPIMYWNETHNIPLDIPK
jgi:hypothetical protein